MEISEDIIKRRGYLPAGNSGVNKLGNSVIQLIDGQIFYDAPHNNDIHHQAVPPAKYPLIDWNDHQYT